eukprot:TRINITY_DN374_c0_g1_i1.p1 TRINITY_DN374_c0_g1~~TRINITY_DN374_c0_g1_i1.p1  ORF type:complete len:121 (+),score=22.42 TRINITY_DN374_c0_g1_i1:57-419(+)
MSGKRVTSVLSQLGRPYMAVTNRFRNNFSMLFKYPFYFAVAIATSMIVYETRTGKKIFWTPVHYHVHSHHEHEAGEHIHQSHTPSTPSTSAPSATATVSDPHSVSGPASHTTPVANKSHQ